MKEKPATILITSERCVFVFLIHFKSSSCWSMLTLTVFPASLSFDILRLHQYSTLLLDAYQIYFILS